MARLFNHSFSGRKAALFAAEQAAVVPAAVLGAAAAAALASGDALVGGLAPLPAIWAALASEGPDAAGEAALGLASALWAGASLRLPVALPWALGAAAGSAAMLYAVDLYGLRRAQADRRSGGQRTLFAVGLSGLVLLALALPGPAAERGAAIGAILAVAAVVVATRMALPALVGPPRRVLIVGAGARAREVARAVVADPDGQLQIAGFVPVGRGLVAPGTGGAPGGLVEAARRARASWVVVAVDDGRGVVPAEELLRCRLAGIGCLTEIMLAERVLRRIPVDSLRPSDLVFADGFRSSRVRELSQRAVDLVAGTAGLLLAAPLLLLAALAVRLDSPGPVFYGQERVGRGGRTFRITKLRTMRVDAEASGTPRWASEDDPRVTRVGRLLRRARIDELPQLFSVLRGDMSLVGPRPERPYFVEQLRREVPWYALRESIRPGLTGWAQLRYPYGASVADAKAKLEYDLYYLKNGSLFLDLAILFHTVRHVLTGRGAR